MKKNHGFTLVEMMMVIGIAGILMGSSVFALNYLKYANIKKCAYEINSMLDKTRVLCMTKGATYLYIYEFDGKTYMKCDGSTLTNMGDGSVIAQGNVEITAYSNDVPAYTKSVGSGVKIAVSFKRSNGALMPDAVDSRTYNKIVVKNKNGEYVIHIAEVTGKHYIEE